MAMALRKRIPHCDILNSPASSSAMAPPSLMRIIWISIGEPQQLEISLRSLTLYSPYPSSRNLHVFCQSDDFLVVKSDLEFSTNERRPTSVITTGCLPHGQYLLWLFSDLMNL
ncbi:unnamed protein product [Lupinus luteus]|uniref:Uncharacterized protein n=1 Tax=Lupinus luteus TaxID=3873 RepID=A0AAV1WWG5_LUPLU